ncbi:MAG: LacI family transcriptional regulator [Lachnospiraceae bacterium]|nr:LacI family transcriptional regulator [Lachnospiraceae bacterium]
MVTISEVAKEAGVSVATVSRVLNHCGKVRPETEQKVKEAVVKLQYTINMPARNLRKNESGAILVLARNFTNPFYAKILEGISDEANPAGYNILVSASDGNPKMGFQCIQMLEGRQVDGAILLNCTEDDAVWLKPHIGKYPIVQCCDFVAAFDTPKVIVDHFRTGYEAVQYLVSLGHRRIAFMGAENKHSCTVQRLEGYKKAIKDFELDEEDALYISADANYTFESGCRAVYPMLTGKNPPTAIFCVSDVLALSCIFEAKELGIRVPEEFSVVGCDDVEYARMCHPFLSTFRLPCYEMGRESARQLLRCIHRTPEEYVEIIEDFSLQVRESTGMAGKDVALAVSERT